MQYVSSCTTNKSASCPTKVCDCKVYPDEDFACEGAEGGSRDARYSGVIPSGIL